MTKKVNCVMLVDDNPDDNFFHERVIRKSGLIDNVVSKTTGEAALNYLLEQKDKDKLHPDLIFLDINMPGMNGWEFLEEYKRLDEELKSQLVVIMLTTSRDPTDKGRAEAQPILSDFQTKPITKEMLEEILNKYF